MKTICKLSLISLLVSSALYSHAEITLYEGEKGVLTFGGDAEYNINYQNFDGDESANDFSQDGRLLIRFNGKTTTSAGYFAEFEVEPILTHNGNVDHDDAWFAFGQENNWDIRVGDFEGYDLFPAGQDTFLTSSAYKVNNARGRGTAEGDSVGHVAFTKYAGPMQFELGVMMAEEDGISDNAVYVRPVVAYSDNGFTLAAGVEMDVTNETNPNDEIGYGVRGSYSSGDASYNAAIAHLDKGDLGGDITSATLNATFGSLGVGYYYSAQDFDASEDEHAIMASYKIPNVLDIKDFSIYLGAYHTRNVGYVDGRNETGVRTRLKYEF